MSRWYEPWVVLEGLMALVSALEVPWEARTYLAMMVGKDSHSSRQGLGLDRDS
jgi:hypothetical protein